MATFRVSLRVSAETFAEAEETEAAGKRGDEDGDLMDVPEWDDLSQEIQSVIEGAITGRGWVVVGFDTIY